VTRALVRDDDARLRAFEQAREDVREAGKIEALDTEPADSSSVTVELAPPGS
jgi:hypothetical protein